jgi:response regulator NasT
MIKGFKVLIAEDEAVISMSLAAMLKRLGLQVTGRARDGREAVKKFRELDPDIILMDIKMPNMDGLEAAKEILSIKPIPIIILTAYSQPDLIEKADSIGVSYYLIKPITEKDLMPAIRLAVSRFKELQALQKEVGDLKEALRARKLIEQAKGVIMEREGLTETEAFRRIQKQSRDSNIPMAKIAESIIIASRILN